MNRYVSSITILGMIIIFSCGDRQKTVSETARPVTVAKVKKWDRISCFYTGGVEAEVYANLAFPFAGPLISLPVEWGERLSKGSLVAAIDPLSSRSDYDSRRAAFLNAKSQWERNLRLVERQAISQEAYELSEAEYVQAKSAYEISKNQLKNTELRTPFEGVVTQKYVENYQRVESGEPVIRLMDPSRMEVVFLLPETDVELLEKEWKVAVEFDHKPGNWFAASRKEVIDASIEGSGIPVRLSITDTLFLQSKYNLLPGFSCRVRIEVEADGKNGYLLPMSAILKDARTDSLWVWCYDKLSEKVTRKTVVTDGLTAQAEVGILSGLQADDWVVVAGGHALTEGEMVKIITH